MNKTDLCYTSAKELSSMIVRKELSPVEVMETVLERVEELNPKLNAICTVTPERAMDKARQAEQALQQGKPLGPLHGIPLDEAGLEAAVPAILIGTDTIYNAFNGAFGNISQGLLDRRKSWV